MTKRNWRQFYHHCRSCKDVLLPMGNKCHGCGFITRLPVRSGGMQWHPWDQPESCILAFIGKQPVVAHYEIESGDQGSCITVKRITIQGKPEPTIKPYYIKMIESVIARAKGIL